MHSVQHRNLVVYVSDVYLDYIFQTSRAGAPRGQFSINQRIQRRRLSSKVTIVSKYMSTASRENSGGNLGHHKTPFQREKKPIHCTIPSSFCSVKATYKKINPIIAISRSRTGVPSKKRSNRICPWLPISLESCFLFLLRRRKDNRGAQYCSRRPVYCIICST